MNEPDQANNRKSLDEILAEYYLRTDRGETIDNEDFIAEYPEYADEMTAELMGFLDEERARRMAA